jgi:hypothetical protein
LYFEEKKSAIESIGKVKVDQKHWPKRLNYSSILYSERTNENEPVLKTALVYNKTTSGLWGWLFILLIYCTLTFTAIGLRYEDINFYHSHYFTLEELLNSPASWMVYIFCAIGIISQGSSPLSGNVLAPDTIGAFVAGGMIVLYWIILFLVHLIYLKPLDKKYLEGLNRRKRMEDYPR